MKKKIQKKQSFSLMELVIVIGIMALLSAVAAPAFFKFQQTAAYGAAQTQIQSFKQAITMYQSKNMTLPSSLDELAQPTKGGPYMDHEVSADPWGNPYQFVKPGPRGFPFDIVSYGADGQPGGEDLNKDISCWGDNK